MKNRTFLLLFLLSTTISYSQKAGGFVFDVTNNQPIEEVHVYINNKEKGTITNGRGKFKIKQTTNLTNKDTIHFSHINYQKKAIPYIVGKDEYLVYLEPKVNMLEEMEVVANKKLKPSIRFNRLTSMKKGRYSFGSILKDNKIYVIGGNTSYKIDNFRKVLDNYSDFDSDSQKFLDEIIRKGKNYSRQIYNGDLLLYDIETDSWEVDELKLRKRANHSINLYDNKIYVLGGTQISRNGVFEYLDDKIEILDIKNNTVIVDNTNPHQAVNFESFSYKDNLIVMGGSIKEKRNGQKEYSNKVHLFNIKSGLWYELAVMPNAKETRGILINDKIYTFGGFNKKPLKDIESLDLISGKWVKEGTLLSEFDKPAITHVNNMVYLFENGKLATFNIDTKELKEYGINLFLSAAELQYADNRLYILGGLKEENYAMTASKGLYRIDLNEFKTTVVKQSAKL